MRRLGSIIIVFTFLTGCLQTENSSSTDAIVEGSPEFQAAQEIFAQSCAAPCHQHSFHTLSEEQMIALGKIVAGDAENSPVYYRSIGSTGPKGPKTMPTVGAALSSEELEVIKEWITGVTP